MKSTKYLFLPLFLLVFHISLIAAPGDLDTTFGSGAGYTTFAIGAAPETANALAIQSDGKIVIGGTIDNGNGDYDAVIVRLNADGTPDSTFGSFGYVILYHGHLHEAEINAITIQPDGKIVAVGRELRPSIPGYSDVFVERFSTSGVPETGFPPSYISWSGQGDDTYAVALKSNGKIIIAGKTWTSPDSRAAIGQLLATNGGPDTGFASSGMYQHNLSSGMDTYRAVLLTSIEKIIAVGYSRGSTTLSDFTLVQYNPSGAVDTTFASNGIRRTDFYGSNDIARAAALQSDGKIVVAGYAYGSGTGNDFALARYSTAGNLDTSFNAGGRVVTNVGGGGDFINALAIQSNGKIVVAGESYEGNQKVFTLGRYNTNGTLDTGFGGGIVQSNLVAGSHGAHAMKLQGDGKIVVAGWRKDGSVNRFIIARYLAE